MDVLEDIYSFSHELQVLWDINENLFLTTGAYYFKSSRNQDYGLHDRASQGRIQNAANYGQLGAFLAALGILTTPLNMQSPPMDTLTIGHVARRHLWG